MPKLNRKQEKERRAKYGVHPITLRNEAIRETVYHGSDFYNSEAWKQLRRRVFKTYGRKCMKCGATRKLNVDHIKPRSFYPLLELEFNNMQILCSRCNLAKSNKHETDYRQLTLTNRARQLLATVPNIKPEVPEDPETKQNRLRDRGNDYLNSTH